MIRLLCYVGFTLVFYHSLNAQELSKKDDWMRRQLIDTPHQLTLDRFLPMWFHEHSCYRYNYFGGFWGMQETGKDSKYAYFKHVSKMRNDNYKVLLSDLEHINFDKWSSCEIIDDFFNRSVAEKDRSREPDLFICTSTPSYGKYTYTYIPNTNSMRIDLHWKIYCEIIFKLVNKKYWGIYHFDTGTFTDMK